MSSSTTPRRGKRPLAAVAAAAALAAVLAGCSSSSSSSGSASAAAAEAQPTTVKISLTSQGCQPTPASVTAGDVEFDVANADASAVSEAELRTSDKSKILGEQENLTPGLSGGFTLTVQPGKYVINCPGAQQQDWTFMVTGKATGTNWQSVPQLASAVSGYTTYVNQNTADLVSHTQTFCKAVSAGNMEQAELLVPAGPCLLRAHRARRRDLGHAGHQHRRPVGEPGHRGVAVHRVPQARAAAVVGQHPRTARRRSAPGLSRTSSSC